ESGRGKVNLTPFFFGKGNPQYLHPPAFTTMGAAPMPDAAHEDPEPRRCRVAGASASPASPAASSGSDRYRLEAVDGRRQRRPGNRHAGREPAGDERIRSPRAGQPVRAD